MQRVLTTIAPLIFTALFLAGCQAAEVFDEARAGQIVSDADWSTMETVTVTLNEFSFLPGTLSFKKGQPYKLEIRNTGSSKHYFTAKDFYKAIATRKVQSNADGEIKAPYFAALEVFPSRSLDLYFVPVDVGTYNLLCTISGHAEQGMVGSIEIVE